MRPVPQAVRALQTGLAAALCLSCSPAPTRTGPSEVPPGAFAIVGERSLSLSLLGGFEGAQRKELARGVVRDELMRAEAQAVAPTRTRAVLRGELARRLIELTESEERNRAQITEEELRAEYDSRWLDYNRPRALRTVQAFFPVEPPLLDDEQEKNADRLLQAVQGTHNLEQFGKQARPILDKIKSARVYEMPPLTKDGRIVPILPKDRSVTGISKHLADAVGKLSNPGDISSVVGTEHGYHVFFVTEVVPEHVVPFSDVRSELERAVFATRVRDSLDAISKKPGAQIQHRRTDIANLLTLVRQGQ